MLAILPGIKREITESKVLNVLNVLNPRLTPSSARHCWK
jgi:hypothetical protein